MDITYLHYEHGAAPRAASIQGVKLVFAGFWGPPGSWSQQDAALAVSLKLDPSAFDPTSDRVILGGWEARIPARVTGAMGLDGNFHALRQIAGQPGFFNEIHCAIWAPDFVVSPAAHVGLRFHGRSRHGNCLLEVRVTSVSALPFSAGQKDWQEGIHLQAVIEIASQDACVANELRGWKGAAPYVPAWLYDHVGNTCVPMLVIGVSLRPKIYVLDCCLSPYAFRPQAPPQWRGDIEGPMRVAQG